MPATQNDIQATLAKLRGTFRTGRTRTMEWRVGQLRALQSMLRDNAARFCEALWKDLHKSPFECVFTEHGFVIEEIDYILERLAEWQKPEQVNIPLGSQPGTARIVHDPLGVVLIIGAWNYPVNLLLAPLVGAIAGGNVAVVKPSEMAAATSSLTAELVPQYLDRDAFAVVEGGAAETQSLLSERFDYIFFTGSGRVGQIVLEKAAKYLTPVALELGGKSPCIVDEGADLDIAARRIVWGKFLNAGQTCVAPDYVLALKSVEGELLKRMREAIKTFYGEDPKQSPDYCRIVNDRNFQRLTKFFSDGEVVCGKQVDPAERYIAPTILRNVRPDAPVMQEEIFGPILPVLSVPDIGAAIEFVIDRPKPLALYVFSENRAHQDRILEETSSGDAAINDVVIHMPVPELPFGGVGASGMGRYHGRWSFDAFTHAKGVLDKTVFPDYPDRYPPYAKKGARRMNERRVVIVGAGIGGLAAHLACRQVGCAVRHFERQSHLGPAGAGLVLWPNGVKVLQALGLGKQLERIGSRPDRLVVRSDDNEILNEISFGELNRRLGVPGYVVSRSDLQTVLLEALEPGSLETGAKCISVETTAEGTVVRFENGRLVAGDVVVGADGIHSAVRRSVVGEVMPRFAGFAAWVGIMDNEGLLSADTATEYLGEGQRFGLLPLTAGRAYFSFACRWEEGTRKPADGWTPFLQKRFAGWPAPALEVIRRLDNEEPICLEIHDLPALPSWQAGRIALLGDAAHATTPTLGQGACQALEDAAALGRCLADFPDVPEAPAHYELERKSRADDIVARARAGAEKMHAPTEDVYRKLYQSIRASSVTQALSVAERWLAQGPIG